MLHTNGHSYPTRPQSFADIFPHHRAIPSERIRQLQELIHNFSLSRDRFLQALTDPRRDVRKECGLPDIITPEMYQDAYDRNALAKRVVEFLPKECAQTPFRVYETENSEDQTPFELALDNLNQQLRGRKSWRKTEEGSSLQKYVLDADIQSRIGRYGVVLIGTDDKLSYDQPAAGVEENGSGEKASKRQYSLNVNAKATKGRKLLYLRVFPESLATIMQFEANESSPRYCQPTQYQITFGDPRQYTYGTGMPTGTKVVHWTRVVHVCEGHVFHTPAMQAVFDNLVGAKQTLSADAEAYFKNCLLKMIFTTQPERGGVDIDVTSLKDMMEEFGNGLQNWAAFQDLNVQTVGPQIADPNSHIDAHIKAICIEGGYPQRAFEGSEQAQLASGQDRKTNQERVKQRRYNHVADNIVEPLTDRFIMLGVLPEPPEGYHIDFPEEEILTPQEQSAVQLSTVQTITAYEAGAKPGLARLDFWTLIMGKTQEEAEAIIKNAEEEAEKEKQKQQDAQIQAGLQQVAQGAVPPGLEQGGGPFPDVPGGEGGAGKEAETFKGEPTGNVDCGTGAGGFKKGNTCAAPGSGGTSHPDEPKGKGKDDTKDGKKPSLISRMKSTLAKKYHALEERYGKAGAVAIAAGMAAMAPIPIPGAMLVPIGIAEGFIAGKKAAEKVTGNEDVINAFCPTGQGGGVDPTCSPGGSASAATPNIGRINPREPIIFPKPITGPSGAKLLAYEWKYQPFEEYNPQSGETVERRISDWDQAEKNIETGRGVVHHFKVQTPSGASQIVSLESAMQILGYTDAKSGKPVRALASSVKTLARLKMDLQLQQARKDTYDQELTKARTTVDQMPYPPVTREVAPDGRRVTYRMGDAQVWDHSGAQTVPVERLNLLKDNWRRSRIAELLPESVRKLDEGGLLAERIKSVKSRIEKAQKKVDAELLTANAAGTSHPDVPADLDETAELIADILHALYGDDAVTLFGTPTANARSWDSTQHPRSQTSGRFIPRGSAEAVATARTAIGRALKGDHSPQDAHDLLNHLSILTVKQLREIQGEHGVMAAGPLRDHLVAGIKSRLEAPKADSTAPPKNPAPGKVYNVATKDLHVDPERFQFKLGTEAGTGVTQELKQVKTWNPDFAGVVSVWKDPADGNTYIVNGHHRHELAARLGVNDMAVRYITANSAKEARAVGALINIAEGRGTAVDAAKFMRDANATPADLEVRGVSLKGKLAQDAAHLTRLSDIAFNRLATGRLDEGKALAVAKHLEDHDLQDQLFRILDRGENEGKDFSPRVIEEMSREMAATPKRKAEGGGGGGLFKDYESEESLFVQRAEVKAHVRAALSREVEDFAAVSSRRRAERVAEAGNILDTEKNRELAKEANRMKNIFDHLVNRRGVISDAINEAAVAYAAATTKRERDAVKQRAVEAARVAVLTELGVNAAGTGPSDQGGTSSPGPERHPGAPQVSGDARRGDAGEDGLTGNDADEGDEKAGKGFHSDEQRRAFFGLKKASEESQAKKKAGAAQKKGKAAKSSPRVPKVGETVRVDGASYVAEPFDGDDTFPPAIASYEVKDGHIFYKGRDGSEGVVTGTPEQAGKWMRDVQEEVARHPPADAIGRAWRPADGGEENVKAATDMVGKAAKTFGVKPPSVNPQVVKNPLVGGEYAAGSLSLSNPHLSNPNESLNFKTSHSQEIHIAAHEMVHAAFSANPSLGHKYIQRLKDSGEKVSLYHALAGNFEGLMDLGGAYVHSPDELKQYSPELYDIADGWAKESKRVNAK